MALFIDRGSTWKKKPVYGVRRAACGMDELQRGIFSNLEGGDRWFHLRACACKKIACRR